MTKLTSFNVVRFIVALLILFVGATVLVVLSGPYRSSAAVMGGYAWSETIGWISLSGPGYGLDIDGSGNVTGYAWSENIGWISAQAADVAGCPIAPCAPALTGTAMTGWLKAIAANGNGWDGWISLSGTGYGVTNTNGVYAGYAWGSDVVGWIDFSFALPPAASCTLLPASQTIVRGSNTNLSWSSVNATTGSTSPGAIPMTPVASGGFAVNPVATTTYTAGFMGGGGYGSCQATVNVQCAPIYSCGGVDSQTIQFTNGGCVTTNVTTCVLPASCVPGQSTCINPPPEFTAGGDTSGHLQAKPQLVRKGKQTKLFWDVTNVSNCTVSGTNEDILNAGCLNGTCSSTAAGQDTIEINNSTIYTLACTALLGNPDFTESVTVLPSPEYVEL